MSTINQINNLANAAATQLSSSSIGGSSQNADWFTENTTNQAQTITASTYFDSGSTVEEMTLSILSCIGDTSTL